MRKEISAHALWMVLALVLSTTALEAADGREAARQVPNTGAEHLMVYLWDQVSGAVADGVELLTGYWMSQEAEERAVRAAGPVDRVSVGALGTSTFSDHSKGSTPPAAVRRAPDQADPTLDMPTSEAGYPQIDPNG